MKRIPLLFLLGFYCTWLTGCATKPANKPDPSITAAHSNLSSAQASATAAQAANTRVAGDLGGIRTLAQRIHDKDVLLLQQEAP